MKLLKYGLPFAALGLMASCSNDNIDAPAGPVENNPVEGMYVSFNINLPGANGTRAGEDYLDGEADEYAIDNIWLYLFRADNQSGDTKESDAQFYNKYKLGIIDTEDDINDDAITKTVSATFQINNTDGSGTDITKEDKENYDYYALIVVNKPNTFVEPNATDKNTFEKWAAYSTNGNVTKATGRAVASVGQNGALTFDYGTTEAIAMMPVYTNKTYFTMTNAPLSTALEGVLYLVKLDTDAFATSPKVAEEAAAEVFVQRGVAKFSLDLDDEDTFDAVDALEDGEKIASVKFLGWAMDVLQAQAYPVQQVAVDEEGDLSWEETWFESSSLGNSKIYGNMYHIYWSIDPNYNESYTANASIPEGAFLPYLTNDNDFNGLDKVEYTLENTMKAQAMQKNQSTRIVFQGQLNLDDAEEGDDIIMYPGTDMACALEVGWLITAEGSGSAPVAGKLPLNQVVKEEYLAAAMKALRMADASGEVYYYPEGKTYYTAIIRHFTASALEPGHPNNDKEVTLLTQYDEEEDLGRYGVVRNNWYQAGIGKVFGYGVPTVPTPTPDPDDYPDPIKYNVQLDIKVLAWTQRGFDYTIK